MLRIYFTLILVIVLSGCAYHGGGTVGTGLPLGRGGSGPSTTGISYVNFTSRLINATGRPLDNVEVTMSTSRTSETAVTDFDGRFILTLVTKLGERVTIKINDGKTNYTQSFVVDRQNINNGSAVITLMNNGEVRVSELRWY